ncbi:hypothetical protein AMTRI_Chr02g262440 [Amborella trichopoda]
MATTPGCSFNSSLHPVALFSLYLIRPLTVLPLQLLQAPTASITAMDGAPPSPHLWPGS